MLCSRKSLYGWIILLPSASETSKNPPFNGVPAGAVTMVGVWHPAQPMLWKIFSPAIVLSCPSKAWSRLTWSWVAFFAFMGTANWYVASHFSTDPWVDFKVWGGIGLFLVFALLQGLWLARYATEETA